jgi:HK97 gp10 family phage protein
MRRRYASAPQIIADELKTSMTRIVLQGERVSKQKAPKWRGQLRQSITHEVSGGPGQVQGEWGTALHYAKFQETGTRPHFVSAANIGAWAAAHGFGNTGLYVSGKAHPFIKPAFTAMRKKIAPEFQGAIRRAMARISGGG